jgi:hypothetical protein
MGSCSSNRGQRGDPSAAVALTAASGASMPAPRGYAQDETPGHISSRVGEIKKWRRGHLVRVPNGGPVAEIPVSVKPTPTAQLPWHAYRKQSDPHYEMIAVEFLVDITERAQPLAGCIDKPLKQVTINGRRMEHFHSIDRIAELAMSHPEVAEVEKHNLHKQYDLSEFGETAPASSSPASGGLPASSSPAPGGLHPPLNPPMAVD